MSSMQRGYATPKGSDVTNPHVMCDSLLQCSMSMDDSCAPGMGHRRLMANCQGPPKQLHITNELEDMEEGLVSPGPPSGDSSGFEGSNGLLDRTSTDQSPLLSNASSLNSHCQYLQSCPLVTGFDVPEECSDRKHTTNESPSLPPSREQRHQSLPTESTPSVVPPYSLHSRPRRRSSPAGQRTSEPPSTPRNVFQPNPVSKLHIRARFGCTAVSVDVNASRSGSNSVHPLPSPLEPIPQGQELSVHTATNTSSLSNGTPSVRNSSKRMGDAVQPSTKSAPSPSGAPGMGRRVSPCCPCRSDEFNGPHGHPDLNVPSADAAGRRHEYATMANKANHYSLEEDNCNGDKSVTKTEHRGSHWARDLFGRLKSNSLHSNSDSTESRSHLSDNRRHSCGRSGDALRCAEKPINGVCIPDGIDPRRLPKTHGPASACLQFAKKPLHPSPNPVSSSSTPIPMTFSGRPSTASALKSASWRPRKQSARVRWLSQSISEEPGAGPSECIFAGSNEQFRLSSSAVEEFQGAVDILEATSRRQAFSASVASVRTGVRVKRASESERLLFVSKSMPDPKDEFSPCSFGKFDENHVYSTLFRHSTCYDVLPDSGKLVMLDSRLGVVRAIRALLENGVQAAPIWHMSTHRVTGLFSQDLALHLLSYLYVSSTAEHIPSNSDLPKPPPPSAKSHPSNLVEGLRLWGTRQLSDVLRLFHADSDREYSSSEFGSALIVSAQTGLKKALFRLLHPSRSPSELSSPRHSHDFDSSQHPQPMDLTDSLDCCFDMDEANLPPSAGRPAAALSRLMSESGIDYSLIPGVAKSSSKPSRTSQLVPPTHLIVMAPSTGNVLGILGTDRLLAYLRLRLDELPYSPQVLSPIDSIPGLRWPDRHCMLHASRMRHSRSESNLPTNSEAVPLPDPFLTPSTPCWEALRALTVWLPQLPALPVISLFEGAATQTNALIGFISPGDILHFVLDSSPDVAINKPVRAILETKQLHCRFHQDCVGHTQETVVAVLDRMFRLRAPGLVLFNPPASGSTISGPPVGLVTAKDLLRAIVGTKSRHQYARQNSAGSVDLTSKSVSESPPPVGTFDIGFGLDEYEHSVEKLTHMVHADSLLTTASNSSTQSSSSDDVSKPTISVGNCDRVQLVPRASQSTSCSCACHHNTAEVRFHENSSLEPVGPCSNFVEGTKKGWIPSPGSYSSTANSSEPVAHVDFTSTDGRHSKPHHPNQPFNTRPSTGEDGACMRIVNERKSVKRGEDDESLFPMD